MDEVASSRPPEHSPLPEEVPACHALLVEQSRSLVELQASREKLSQELEELKLTVTKLLNQLHGRRSERSIADPNQMPLDFGDDSEAQDALAAAAAEAETIVQEFTVRREIKKRKPRDERLPAHLERYEVIADAPDEQKLCPDHGERQVIGYDVTETLEFERPKLKIRVTKYPKYACVGQAACGIGQAERTTGLVEGNRYDTSVAAEIAAGKFFLHLPHYRQQDQFAASGWTPSRSTLVNIATAAATVLEPLADDYRRRLLQSGGIGCDDTTLTLITPATIPALDLNDARARRIHEVLSKAHAEGRVSITARMWGYRSFELPINVFDFTISRHRDGPDEFLKDYVGGLMGDCWSGFRKIELRSDARIVRAACWSHARRKVFEGRSSHPQQASVLLAMIRELYDIEDRGKRLPAEERRALRERESRPMLERIRAFVDHPATVRVPPKSAFGEALSYLRNHWDALQTYVSDGRMPIDNNDDEQLMKQIAVGRKNWMFVGSLEAGARAATLMTIISTAARNDLDVYVYLKDVLDQLLAGSTDYRSLHADVWKQSHPEAVRSYRTDERRDATDRRRHRRAQRRLAKRSAAQPS